LAILRAVAPFESSRMFELAILREGMAGLARRVRGRGGIYGCGMGLGTPRVEHDERAEGDEAVLTGCPAGEALGALAVEAPADGFVRLDHTRDTPNWLDDVLMGPGDNGATPP